jgi:hypothetical protein
LILQPTPNANGQATITVTVNDGAAANNLNTVTFTVTVSPVDDPPTLDPIANVSINEGAPPQTVNLTGISSGAGNEIQTLVVIAASDKPDLIPTPSVNYASPNSTSALNFTPVTGASGRRSSRSPLAMVAGRSAATSPSVWAQ